MYCDVRGIVVNCYLSVFLIFSLVFFLLNIFLYFCNDLCCFFFVFIMIFKNMIRLHFGRQHLELASVL